MNAPTVDDLAAELEIPVDDRMAVELAAAIDWVQRRRSTTDPMVLFDSAAVRKGTVLLAALGYQSKASPGGFPGYDEFGGYPQPTDNAMRRIYSLVGQDVVVA